MKPIKRRTFLANSVTAGAAALGLSSCSNDQKLTQTDKSKTKKAKAPMFAGFVRAKITPPLGTTMKGFGTRDCNHGCDGVHDDLYVTVLYLEHANEKCLIIGYDLCLLGHNLADQIKGAIGRKFDILPRQILLNTSHTHLGPQTGTWRLVGNAKDEPLYCDFLNQTTIKAACQAKQSLRPVTVWCGTGETKIPRCRRRIIDGVAKFRPYPEGITYNKLPVCLFKDTDGKPVCLLFSVSTHPTTMAAYKISAEYPGVAKRTLDKHFGAEISLFLQGVAGDSKPSVIDKGGGKWASGSWELIDKGGKMVAAETIAAIEKGVTQVTPDLRSAIIDTKWPMLKPPARSEFEAIVTKGHPEKPDGKMTWQWFVGQVRYLWAKRHLELLDKYGKLPTHVKVVAQGIKLADGLRIFTLEGEAVAEWGYFIEKFYGNGVTFPLGYSNGATLYLPVTRQLPEGGYEVDSYNTYPYPAQLAPGMEDVVLKALKQLRRQGIN